MSHRVLVVDDEAVVRKSFERIFAASEVEIATAPSGSFALETLQEENFDLVITDLKMPGMNGLEFLRAIKILQPNVPVIMVTGYSTVGTAVEAMRCGAQDYIEKPFTPELITEKVMQALQQAGQSAGQAEPIAVESMGPIMGSSPAMQRVYQRIEQVAPTDSTVLITGESGTGKELVARAIHDHSPRKNGPFVAVDCTALAENLLESELFGHVKGSFTGAIRTKTGLFKVADGGTLFLDEISNLSSTIQAKLLRVLQMREITPIGGTNPTAIDIRLVAATNQDLKERVAAGVFREDLYFRLNIIPIRLPPLRQRGTDLQLLAGHFLHKFAAETGKNIRGIDPGALELLRSHDFPGNVRELENLIERAVVLCADELLLREDLELHELTSAHATTAYVPQTADELKELKRKARECAVLELERAFLLDALERNGWNVTRAAEETGMLRPNFQAMLRKHDLSARQRNI